MGDDIREVSRVLATFYILSWEMYSFVNIYLPVHSDLCPSLWTRHQKKFYTKQKIRWRDEFGPQAIICQLLIYIDGKIIGE